MTGPFRTAQRTPGDAVPVPSYVNPLRFDGNAFVLSAVWTLVPPGQDETAPAQTLTDPFVDAAVLANTPEALGHRPHVGLPCVVQLVASASEAFGANSRTASGCPSPNPNCVLSTTRSPPAPSETPGPNVYA